MAIIIPKNIIKKENKRKESLYKSQVKYNKTTHGKIVRSKSLIKHHINFLLKNNKIVTIIHDGKYTNISKIESVLLKDKKK